MKNVAVDVIVVVVVVVAITGDYVFDFSIHILRLISTQKNFPTGQEILCLRVKILLRISVECYASLTFYCFKLSRLGKFY